MVKYLFNRCLKMFDGAPKSVYLL